jgi:hypothetical protein
MVQRLSNATANLLHSSVEPILQVFWRVILMAAILFTLEILMSDPLVYRQTRARAAGIAGAVEPLVGLLSVMLLGCKQNRRITDESVKAQHTPHKAVTYVKWIGKHRDAFKMSIKGAESPKSILTPRTYSIKQQVTLHYGLCHLQNLSFKI